MLLPFFGKGAQEREYVADALKEVAGQAERAGILLGLEDTISAEDNVGKARICQMHLKDRAYIGDEPIDFTAVMRAITDIGYEGFANLETSTPSCSVEDDMRRNLKAVREYLAKARKES